MSINAVDRLNTFTFTILDGATASDIKNTLGTSLVAIITPPNYQGTIMNFKGGRAEDSLFDLYNTLDEKLSPIVKANRMTLVFPADFNACTFLQLISDTAQTSDVQLTVIARSL